MEPDVTARLGAYAPLLQHDGEPGAREGGTDRLVRGADGRRGPPVGEIGVGGDIPIAGPGGSSLTLTWPATQRPFQGSSRSEGWSMPVNPDLEDRIGNYRGWLTLSDFPEGDESVLRIAGYELPFRCIHVRPSTPDGIRRPPAKAIRKVRHNSLD